MRWNRARFLILQRFARQFGKVFFSEPLQLRQETTICPCLCVFKEGRSSHSSVEHSGACWVAEFGWNFCVVICYKATGISVRRGRWRSSGIPFLSIFHLEMSLVGWCIQFWCFGTWIFRKQLGMSFHPNISQLPHMFQRVSYISYIGIPPASRVNGLSRM